MSESNFGEFEDDILHLLHAQQAIIQERNSIKGFVKALESCRHSLTEVGKKISSFEQEYQAFLGDLENCQAQVAQSDYRSQGEAGLQAELKQIGATARDACYTILEAGAGTLKQRLNQKMTGEKLNTAIKRFAGDIGQK